MAMSTAVQKGFSALNLDAPVAISDASAALTIDQKIAKLASITGAPLSSETEDQLRALFAEKAHPIAYDGVEPSGRVTLASGLLRALNAQRLMDAGCHVRLLVADTHALLNNKFGGDLKKLQTISTYMMEVWKSLGLDAHKLSNLEILLASTETARHAGAYWSQVLDAAGQFTVERVQQCAPIMGRKTDDAVQNTNRILYPLMQLADGFLLQADIYQLGVDQEAGNELVRDYIAQKGGLTKPVFLTHPLLLGLKQDQFKMSTTDAESAIYVDDTAAEVKTKIKKAYCVPGEVNGNPVLNHMKYLVFPLQAEGITLERSEKNGGDLFFTTYDELEKAFVEEIVHPADLKPCLTKYINALLEPVRQHFANGPLKTMFSSIKKLKVSPIPDSDKLANLTLLGFPETVKEWKPSSLSLEERYTVARSVGEECIQESELQDLLERKANPVCYDGFEPSGRMHIAQGVLRTVNVNKLTSTGSVFRFWVADWFAMLNNKMGGDLDKIRLVGRYMVEIWESVGMDMTNVEFLWASQEIIAHSASYWLRVMDIARRTTIARTLKCCTIMGRKEKEGMQAAQILYPLMQCADIFNLKADICQLGIDQRKINMLARDYCEQAKIRFKPVILSHHMLMGLKEGQEKMSKSDPESAIFMEDAIDDVSRKIDKAFCPEGVVEANPILDYMKHIICPRFADGGVTVKLADGSTKTFTAYQELEDAFVARQVIGADLKKALTEYLNEYVPNYQSDCPRLSYSSFSIRILAPVREHFSKGEAKDLLAKVRSFRITR
ncbi:putative aminoacyl-tRNA synthetase, class Ic, rossmann-like alpha/beta/alpha sandwich [Plasmopara halstedii]